MSHDAFVQALYIKIFKLSDIYQFELEKFMHKFHHGKLPERYNEFFKSLYQTRFANIENYFIHQVLSNVGKKLSSYMGTSLWTKVEQNLKALLLSTFLQSITRVRIHTVLSKQTKFQFYCLLLNFIKLLLSFFVFCFFVIFSVLKRVSLWYIKICWSCKIHFIHLDQITLGFGDAFAISCTFIFDFLRISVNTCTFSSSLNTPLCAYFSLYCNRHCFQNWTFLSFWLLYFIIRTILVC